MIRRIFWPAIFFLLLLWVFATVQETDEQIAAGEFHQVAQIQRGN